MAETPGDVRADGMTMVPAGGASAIGVEASHQVGHVDALWRYPVKSVGGERVAQLTVGPRGVVGDRRWAVVGDDGKVGSGKTTRRFRRMPGLLSLQAETDGGGMVWIRLPDGARRMVTDPMTADAIGSLVGEPVRLLEESLVPYLDDAPVHLVTTGAMTSLARDIGGPTIDPRRFRPNVVIDAGDDDQWAGRRLRIGTSVLEIAKPTERCVMVTMAQPGVAFVPSLLREIERRLGGNFGQYATVVKAGAAAVGDPVLLV